MIISIRASYGIRFLLYLAKSEKNRLIKLNEVAKSENISEKYLENVVSSIKSTGIIQVKRGARGGYKLAKELEQIFIKDIFIALEGHVLKSESLKETIISGVVENFWEEMKTYIEDYLKSKTLKDLLEEYNRKIESGNQMFYI
jgi:Rrf2 family protein